jgi:DNA-binding transcriptional ArsR family regulator
MTMGAPSGSIGGDADVASIGALVGDPGRARILLALDDGRALPASVLAAEAGVHPSTASSHLAKLVAGGLLSDERHGRHRYFKLAGPEVATLLEALARVAPVRRVTSLREGTRAHQLRQARTCYDHLAGRLGVSLMTSLLRSGYLAGGDGARGPSAPRAGYAHEVDYRLTDAGRAFLADLDVTLPPRRRAVRHCIDWSEQRHHLAGGAGRGLLDRFVASGWIRQVPRNRAVLVTPAGSTALREHFAIDWSEVTHPRPPWSAGGA